jgi:histidinol phosphatase-like PHP family hydrolase
MRRERFFDYHVHSVVSGDSRVPLEERARTAQGEHPHGISDHFPSTQLRSLDDVARYVDRARSLGLRVALEYDIGFAPPLPRTIRDSLDYLVGGLHQITVDGVAVSYDEAGSYLKRRVTEFADRARYVDGSGFGRAVMEEILRTLSVAFEAERFDILAHPTFSPLAASGEAEASYPAEWQEGLIGLCVRHGTALEVNESYRLPHAAFLRRARDAGARFSVGSDSHEALLPLLYVEEVIVDAKIESFMRDPREASGQRSLGSGSARSS